MKIEKINDNQIRCILTREDLELHHIKLDELRYGTEKAKRLFRDMMLQAQSQFGFEADNMPLMIEAIPVNNMESLILIITKVEDPEELDTRFSKFAPFRSKDGESIQIDGADSIIDYFQKRCEAVLKNLTQGKEDLKDASSDKEASQAADKVSLIRLYTFRTLDEVIAAAQGLNGYFDGDNTLYKAPADGAYQLVLHQSGCTPEKFNKICNILSEYGSGKTFSAAGAAYLAEHGECIARQAIQTLAQL